MQGEYNIGFLEVSPGIFTKEKKLVQLFLVLLNALTQAFINVFFKAES